MSSYLQSNDIWNADIYPSDGYEFGVRTTSIYVQVSKTSVTISDLKILPSYPNENDILKVKDIFLKYRTTRYYCDTKAADRPNQTKFIQIVLADEQLNPLFKKVHNYYIDSERKQIKTVLIGVKLNEDTD